MLAGTGKINITPQGSVWMDGMLRAHPSIGIHDDLFARVLVLSEGLEAKHAFALVSIDVCVLDEETTRAVQLGAEARTGIPAWHIILAATHTHSGPATAGILTPREDAYVEELTGRLSALIEGAAQNLHPVEVAVTSGREDTISHYRRLLADDGHVVMNWEPYPPDYIIGPLGIADDEVGVVKVVAADDSERTVAVLFNHAGHPNILSGDNYLLSADYPGLAAQLLEEELGAEALFFNGAQGSVDIDGLQDRDWEGLDRAGHALASSVTAAARAAVPSGSITMTGAYTQYVIPGRRIKKEEWEWAQEILAVTGGKVQAMADGVGDDYKAALYQQLREAGPQDIPVQQVCLALGDSALLTFPGELYTEIGQYIKAHSPFRRTFIIGLANGYVGYIPTQKAVEKGGYAEDTRRVDEIAERLVVDHSLALLESLYKTPG